MSDKRELVVNSTLELGFEENEGKGKGRYFRSRFIEPGVAHYNELGDILITKETLNKFIETIVGCPVIIDHKDVTDKNVDKLRVGVVSKVWFNEYDGYFYCEGILTDPEAIDLVKNKGWNVSCAYSFVSDNTKRLHNGKEIDMEFTDGEFLHLALVEDPRYEGANIVVNKNDDDVEWITVKGNHIPVKKGQSKDKAVKEFLKDKESSEDEKKSEPFYSDEFSGFTEKQVLEIMRDEHKTGLDWDSLRDELFESYGISLKTGTFTKLREKALTKESEKDKQDKKESSDKKETKTDKRYYYDFNDKEKNFISESKQKGYIVYKNYPQGELIALNPKTKIYTNIDGRRYEETAIAKDKLKLISKDNKTNNSIGDITMTVLNDLTDFIKKVVSNEKEDEMKKVKNEDKRKLIDEVGGILKGKVDDEIIRTIMKKMEEASYEPSEDDKIDNKCKNEEDKEEDKEAKNKCKNEEEEKEDKKEDKKEDITSNEEDKEKEDKTENKKVNNSMKDLVMGGNNSTEEERLFISRKERLKEGNKY